MIYMDAAASAGYKEVDNVVVDAITNAMKTHWLNPSSLYSTNVKKKIDNCRANIAKFIGAKPKEIYFTSSASESNNWAIRGWVDEVLSDKFRMVNIITTPIEHKSILDALQNKNLEVCVQYCDVDKYGFVDYNSLKSLLEFYENEPILVSICMANNEIGTIQDIKRIANLVHKFGGVLHIDATQAIGHIPVNVEELEVDMLSMSGHKISPVLKGIGFLYKRNSINIRPLIYGSQENGLRGGTENVFGIIGLSKALEHCDISQDKIDEMCKKRDYFVDALVSKFNCKLNGHHKERLPNNISATFPQDITNESLLYTLDLAGVAINTGSACNSNSVVPSHVLLAIGLDDTEAMKTVRFTLSDNVTYEEIDTVIKEIDKAIKVINS